MLYTLNYQNKWVDNLYDQINENMTPLSFPIIINDRYNVWKLLMDNHVYCTIHWELLNEIDEN